MRSFDFIRLFSEKEWFFEYKNERTAKREDGHYKGTYNTVPRRVAVFLVCLAVLYGGENVGLSDNGDFRRVLLTNKIGLCR